jgi:C1A family cysteine protease
MPLAKAIMETTPCKKPSSFSKRWWTNELIKLRKELNDARNTHKRTSSHADWTE